MLEVDVTGDGPSLSELLDGLQREGEIVLRRNGKAIARLVGSDRDTDRGDARAAIDEMRELRKSNVLGPDLTVRDLIDEGRR